MNFDYVSLFATRVISVVSPINYFESECTNCNMKGAIRNVEARDNTSKIGDL